MAGYQYEFDSTRVGDARYDREEYEILQGALKLLEAKLSSWNQVAMTHGALEPPYSREVSDLRGMIEWGDERLSDKSAGIVLVHGISVGSVRYQKAALLHAAWYREKEVAETAKSTWPQAVAEAMRGRVRRYYELADEISHPSAAILEELRSEYGMNKPQSSTDASWDAFVSHASEDKDIHTGIVQLLDGARSAAARSVNSVMTASYWEIGRRIIEYERGGGGRAGYGQQLLKCLSADLTTPFRSRFWRGQSPADAQFLPVLAASADLSDSV